MQQVHMQGPGAVTVVESPQPERGEGEAVVQMTSFGLCAGDVAAYRGENVAIAYPLTLGHEALGVVRESSEADLPIGTQVIVVPSITCGECAACLGGRENHCPDLVVMGVGNPEGVFRDYVTLPVRQLIPVPDDVADTYGALIEPVAIAVHIVGRTDVSGSDVLVIGGGVTGLLSAQVAVHRGAAHVTVVDKVAGKQGIAEAAGFTDFVLNDGPDLADRLLERRSGYDVVLETVGTDETAKVATTVLRPGGTLLAIAAPNPSRVLTIDYVSVYRKELSVVASRNYTRQDFRTAIELLSHHAVDPRPIVTGRFPLSRVDDALRELSERPEGQVKILLEP